MANSASHRIGLSVRSSFSDFRAFKTPDLSIEQSVDLTIASVAVRAGQLPQLISIFAADYGVDLPQTPKRIAGRGVAVVWAGPGLWFVVADRSNGRDMETELKSKLAGIASVVDQSDSRAVLRISGKAARDTLAKGLPIDLHASAFKPGDVAITQASHIGVMIWQLDDSPTYEIAMFRSFADSFWHWLHDAATSTTKA